MLNCQRGYRSLFWSICDWIIQQGLVEILNVEKLTLPVATATGTDVLVGDGFYVTVFGDSRDGFWFDDKSGSGTAARYVKALPYVDEVSLRCTVTNTISPFGWLIGVAGGSDTISAEDDEAFPWLSDWTTTGLTLTHPAAQTLAAPGVDAMVVAGGTQDGTYVQQGLYADKPAYYTGGASFLAWNYDDNNLTWQIGSSPTQLYYSAQDVATPDLVTDWKNSSDNTPAAITVTYQRYQPQGAVFVSGGTQDGVYPQELSQNGKNGYALLGHNDPTATPADTTLGITWTTRWEIQNGAPEAIYYSLSDVATPDLVPFNHMVVTGAGAGDYTERGTYNGKPYYNLVGEQNGYQIMSIALKAIGSVLEGEPQPYSWVIFDSAGSILATETTVTTTPVATPDLATFNNSVVSYLGWKNASDDSPASITVTSLTVGELAAGVVINGTDFYQNQGLSFGGYPVYTGLGAVAGYYLVAYNGTWWKNTAPDDSNDGVGSNTLSAFPWGADWTASGLTVLRDDVCSEANWQETTP